MTTATIVNEMLTSRPTDTRLGGELMAECVERLTNCAQACTQCADDCLAEQFQQHHMAKCIRLNQDCADICSTAARVLSRQAGYVPDTVAAMLSAAIEACGACALVCEEHSQMDHCAACARHCREAENVCGAMLRSLPGLV
ncbi:MAG: four-helix bundle copper-binding protein [Actinobacteria bacterium]|nr:four-helix bundle copper-binding protein [Actinomycetota bacterium]